MSGMSHVKVMLIFGTRPEAIKMAPVVRELQRYPREIQVSVVVTAQHRAMLDQVLKIFDIEPDYDLDIMLSGQTLSDITVRALSGLEKVMVAEKPDLVLVQGDTTTAFAGGLAAFYQQIPIGHVEAGLRTRDKYNPYPEEMNRHFLDVMSEMCFAPTLTAKAALLAESIPTSRIVVTGNTVIDALLTTASRVGRFSLPVLDEINFGPPYRTILVTAHRRENLGAPMEDICAALRDVLRVRKDVRILFPVHLNPRVRATVWSILGDAERVRLIDPLDYADFVKVLQHVHFVVTDSGGVQEEAPALGKPVLVIRTTTERPEAIEAGTAKLVGTEREDIAKAMLMLLDDPKEYSRMKHAVNPYGDGYAAARTVAWIRHYFGLTQDRPVPFGGELLAEEEVPVQATQLQIAGLLARP
jgi:UDP-N-acetylglucosamine 2-epimerase (non-hydrolysing)